MIKGRKTIIEELTQKIIPLSGICPQCRRLMKINEGFGCDSFQRGDLPFHGRPQLFYAEGYTNYQCSYGCSPREWLIKGDECYGFVRGKWTKITEKDDFV